ncbi:hypothetical protein [Cytobacillus sp. IB215665]|uniref:hypothetical protein n=1 Tax=Cytobacillus sp. IB215665 TaxID=3097357 RepID=UPI002A17FE53|nr:hypothetical protein [Cytobacillus sp. IB215665]MDX8366743.1 hypothetical protein [Cytobacillus sp. IB215665]
MNYIKYFQFKCIFYITVFFLFVLGSINMRKPFSALTKVDLLQIGLIFFFFLSALSLYDEVSERFSNIRPIQRFILSTFSLLLATILGGMIAFPLVK